MALSGSLRVILLTTALACGKRAKPTENVADTPENQALMRKVDGYLTKCQNDHPETVFRLEDRYRERFGETAPLPSAEVALPRISDPKECLDAIAAAKAMAPALPEFDAAVTAFGAALSIIYRLTTPYDRTQAGRTHPELLAAFDTFDRAQALVFDQIYQINRKVHIAQFEQRVRKEGRTLANLVEETQLRGEDVVRFAAIPSGQLDQLDVPALSASLTLLERAIEGLNAFDATKPDETRSFPNFYRHVEHANQLAVAARQLAYRARSNVAFSDSEKLMISAGDEAAVVGTPGALAHAYNRMAEIR